MSDKITSLGVVFDASQVAPSAPMEALPPGWYPVIIVDGDVKTNGANKRLALEWQVIEGPFKGRKIFDGFNIIHENPQAAEIAARDFSAICHAVSVFQVGDVGQLFNKPHQIKVDVEAARTVNADGQTVDLPPGSPNTKTYEAKNRFKGAKAYTAGAASPTGSPVATGSPAAPAWAANGAAAAAAPAATATPPWGAGNAAATPATAGAGAPAASAASSPTSAAPTAATGKPKGKPGPKPKTAAAPKVERKFFVGVEAPEFADALPESKVAAFIAQGMPVDTPVCLEGEEDYKPASAFGIGQAPAPAVAAPVSVAAPAAVVAPAAVATGSALPPWAK